MRKIAIFLFLLSGMTIQAATIWQRAIMNYNRHDYMAANQNWNICQAPNGWVYFANNQGLLEYDGVYWNTYPVDNHDKLRAIKIGVDRIYAGGLGQFGYFKPDEMGRLTYTCLQKSTEKVGNINIWNIHILGNRVYFQADNVVYYYENGQVGMIPCAKGVNYSAVVYHNLYAATGDGIYMLMGNRFQKLQGIQLPAAATVVSLLPYDDKMLIVTSDNGLYLYHDGTVTPWHNAADELIAANELTCAALSETHLALGTTRNGIILLNNQANRAENISMAEGLQNKSVLSTTFDQTGNLWVGLDNGIDNVILNSPLYILNSRLSSIGAGYGSSIYDGRLYLGTNQGLYTTDSTLGPQAAGDMQLVEGTGGQVHGLTLYDDKLFCGGRKFFIMVDGTHIKRFPMRGVWHVCPIGHRSDVLLVGDYWGLKVLRKTANSWELSHKVEGVSISAKSMLPEEGSNAVWVANKTKGLFRLTLSDDLTRVVQKKSYNSPQLPVGDNVCIAKVNHDIVIASRQGLFRYDAARDRLEPHTQLEKQLDGKTVYTYIKEDQQGNIWYVSNGILGILRFDPTRKTYYKNKGEAYLSDELIEDFEHIYVVTPHSAVIGTQEGFALLRYGREQRSHQPLTLQIRRVTSTNRTDSLLYGRSFIYTDKPLRIKYRHNSIRIEYSADNYDKAQTVLYSCRLKGSPDDRWSEYSRQHVKEYTNLDEGKYTFEVRTVTATDRQPVVTSFTFRVLPPWYRAWWAYLLYALVIAAAAYSLIARVLRGRRQLNQKIETLEDEKIQIELRSKQDELVRSRMNVVRKNEMLQEIKKTAVSLNNSLSEDNLPSIKRKVVRLIGQIETNIEHDDDLEAFKGDFDAVHHDFLHKLSKRYPQLTHKDKMLCAYLKMNLISKEIAPLLNISVRGVEISRYRLRKKLGLDEKTNLAEFLQKEI